MGPEHGVLSPSEDLGFAIAGGREQSDALKQGN